LCGSIGEFFTELCSTTEYRAYNLDKEICAAKMTRVKPLVTLLVRKIVDERLSGQAPLGEFLAEGSPDDAIPVMDA